MHVSTLDLDWCTRAGGCKTDRDFLDFVVDGRPLRQRFEPTGNVGVLGWGLAEHEAITRLLLHRPSELPTGRVPLYVCADCGGVDCGTVAARVEETAGRVVWSDFTFEVTYFYESEDERVQARFQDVGPFVFDGAEYRDVLARRLAQVAA